MAKLTKKQKKALGTACKLDDFATYLESDVTKAAERAGYRGEFKALKMAKAARKQAKRAWSNYRSACRIRR